MLHHYITTAIRNLLRNKVYASINILGLAIGMACCMLIILFVHKEFRYDRHVDNADRIYRVVREVRRQGTDPLYSPTTQGQLAPALQNEYPEIVRTARFYQRWNLVSYENNGFMQYLNLVDPEFMDLFGYRLRDGGNAKDALSEPYSVVITDFLATKLFGDEDPVGKVITVEERGYWFDYTISGVILIPGPSHLEDRVDLLTTTVPPIPDVRRYWEEWRVDPSLARYTTTYLLLDEGNDPAELERKLPGFVERHYGSDIVDQMTFHLQPLARIHLHSYTDYGINQRWGNIQQIYLYSAVAFFVLVIACINFMNLATARSAGRAKEVGMRKSVGARRVQLIRQFLGESVLLALLAFVAAVTVVVLVLPSFNAFVARPLTNGSATPTELVSVGMIGSTLSSLACVALAVGLLAGSYPAFFLSGYQPVQVLKGDLKRGPMGAWLRKGLVVFQFSISLVGIVGSIVVYHQMEYVQNKDLGFETDQVVWLYLLRHAPAWRPRYQTVKQAFLQHPNITEASASGDLPGALASRGTRVRPLGDGGEERQMQGISVDEDFLDLFGLNLVAGRNLSRTYAEAGEMELILNHTAVKSLGWADPVGMQLELKGIKGTVVGVVQDFHVASVHQKIGPLVMYNRQNAFKYVSLKIHPDDVSETIAFLEKTWKQFAPLQPFSFRFLDDRIDRIYVKEKKLRKVSGIAFALAIFVACLGLYALAAYTAEQRTKEIGIRKTLGATVPGIVQLFTMDFVKLVAAANVIAWPVAWYVMDEWLSGFAYRIDLEVWPFLFGGASILVIALATVSYHAIKAATAHPVDALSRE